jgi:hypothetical protein
VAAALLAAAAWGQGTPAARGAPLAFPLTAAGLRGYLAERPGTTLEGLLAALPPSFTGSFVLMHTSLSRQQATPARPRQIIFGPDARFLLAVAAVPGDPLLETLEFAEFDPAGGAYHFGTVTFTPGQAPLVDADVALCADCHGTPTRPIWAQYPTWPGAYGDDQGHIDPALQSAFAAFAAAAPADPRFRHLPFSAAKDGSTFGLTSRVYPYANTDFNHELGNTVAIGILARLKSRGDYAKRRWAALAASPSLGCIDSSAWYDIKGTIEKEYAATAVLSYPPAADLETMAYRLMGVDPVAEWSLDQVAAGRGDATPGGWQTGAYLLEEAVTFQVLVDAAKDDEGVKGILAPVQDVVDGIVGKRGLVGEERAEALKESYAWYQYFEVYDPLKRDVERVCGYLRDKVVGLPRRR